MERDLNTIWEDRLYPTEGASMPDPELQGRRYIAIMKVLCEIPEDDYKILKNKSDTFHWFIPAYWEQGKIYPFIPTISPSTITPLMSITYRNSSGKERKVVTKRKKEELRPLAQVLYLSPRLETASFDFIVAVVAHELAHIFLGHEFVFIKDYEKQEKEAWEQVRQWGYEKEEKKHSMVSKMLDTREKNLCRKLMEETAAKSKKKTSKKRKKNSRKKK